MKHHKSDVNKKISFAVATEFVTNLWPKKEQITFNEIHCDTDQHRSRWLEICIDFSRLALLLLFYSVGSIVGG